MQHGTAFSNIYTPSIFSSHPRSPPLKAQGGGGGARGGRGHALWGLGNLATDTAVQDDRVFCVLPVLFCVLRPPSPFRARGGGGGVWVL